ncbi:ATP-binding protein involved in chromosome partitioning [Friedmanniella endophytica]|uniref:Iron-sulfur cluster carrier protein n=1 Tax=Microlunatus kandeliicorticis TaxID=1759536 RepID=A0A7W3P4H5_9ACTN|nr:P-loop NTPase [Microlunatus kandeliicorticis]MBA8792899.1 ATP-binding protein involved in chromosome partitioning [Microlunatus kandeliicorticis]
MSRAELDDRVRSAIEAVVEPELGRSLADLGLVREVRTGPLGGVRVEVALTSRGYPMAAELRTAVTAAAESVTGVRKVSLDFTVLSEAERERVAGSVRSVPEGVSPARAVYAVASGKGGVGKSSVAANLAVAWATEGKRVGLIDADVWGYSVPQLFGIHRAPTAMNQRMLPVPAHGVGLMSLGFFVAENEPVVWRGPMLHKALSQFVTDVAWDDLDVLVLDLPPGTGDVTLSVLELLPDAALLAVTTPQPAARSVASRVGAMARSVSMPVAGVIENMTELVCADCSARTPVFGSGGGTQLAAELGCPLVGQIPLDIQLREAGDAGVPVVLSHPDSPSARALRQTAAAVRPVRRSLLGRSLSLTPVTR